METISSWETVSDSGRREVVLAADYSVNGRHEAGFDELATRLGDKFTIWGTLAPSVGDEVGMTSEQYLDRWLDDVRSSGREVSAVLGYCASSSFAGVIAEGVAKWQERAPRVILFDPAPATAWTILHFAFFKVIESLAGTLSDEEIVEVQKAGWQVAAEYGEDMEAFGTKIVDVYREVGDKAFERIGLNAQNGDQLTAWFRGYVSYLIAASEFSDQSDLSQATVICSSALAEPPGEVQQELRFDVDHADLLRSDEVARTLTELLA